MGTIANGNIKTESTYYWLASRRVFSDSYSGYFAVRDVDTSGRLRDGTLCNVYSLGGTLSDSPSHGFRPVFTLNSEIKVTEGDGETTPYTLAP